MPFRRKQLTQEKLYVPGYILGDITLELALSTTLPFLQLFAKFISPGYTYCSEIRFTFTYT